ncbi:MAG: hypothetical protein H0T60_05145 [Acidobacteria bacterium]|nr:hypothetical protein [Acidobacteriota bacterium]
MGKTTERPSYRAWYEKNRERIKEKKRAWEEANAEHVQEYARSYKEANRERNNANSLARYYADQERAKAAQRRHKRNLRNRVIEAYGSVCACCRESRLEFLAIDHINGGGNQHRKVLKISSGSDFYRYLIKQGFPQGYQVLCHNCNMALGCYGYCPHTKVAT